MAEEDWGELSITMPVNTVVVVSMTISVSEDGSPKIGSAVHVPDPDMSQLAKVSTPIALRRLADEIEADRWNPSTAVFENDEKEQEDGA